jgi:hypothetical protein
MKLKTTIKECERRIDCIEGDPDWVVSRLAHDALAAHAAAEREAEIREYLGRIKRGVYLIDAKEVAEWALEILDRGRP